MLLGKLLYRLQSTLTLHVHRTSRMIWVIDYEWQTGVCHHHFLSVYRHSVDQSQPKRKVWTPSGTRSRKRWMDLPTKAVWISSGSMLAYSSNYFGYIWKFDHINRLITVRQFEFQIRKFVSHSDHWQDIFFHFCTWWMRLSRDWTPSTVISLPENSD